MVVRRFRPNLDLGAEVRDEHLEALRIELRLVDDSSKGVTLAAVVRCDMALRAIVVARAFSSGENDRAAEMKVVSTLSWTIAST